MKRQPTAHVRCSICGRQLPPNEVVPGELVRPSIAAAIGREIQEIQTELMGDVTTHRRTVEPRG